MKVFSTLLLSFSVQCVFAQNRSVEITDLPLDIYSNYLFSSISIGQTSQEPKIVSFSFITKPVKPTVSFRSNDIVLLSNDGDTLHFSQPIFDTIYYLNTGGFFIKTSFQISAPQITKLRASQIKEISLLLPFREVLSCYLTKKGAKSLQRFFSP